MRNSLYIVLLLLSACIHDHNSGGNDAGYKSMNAMASPWVIFLADKDTMVTFELFQASLASGELRRLSHALPENADVRDFVVSPDRRFVAYRATSGHSTPNELYVARTDGGGAKKLSGSFPTSGDNLAAIAGVSQYGWSSDSSLIAYLARNQDGVAEPTLYVVEPESGLITNIAPQTEVGSFLWSPTSLEIAYFGAQIGVNNSLGIYVVNLDKSTSVKASPDLLSDENIYSNTFLWAPDGSRLAFLKETASDQDEMFTVLPTGADRRKIAGDVFIHLWAWAPDSNSLAYIERKNASGISSELYSIARDGTTRQKLSGTLPVDGEVSNFAWSPDSTRIAYHISRFEEGVPDELYSVRPDGTQRVKISGQSDFSENPFTLAFYWAPNSQRLAFIATGSASSSRLFIANPDGSNLTGIGDSSVDSGIFLHPQWSPDSSQIAFHMDRHEYPLFIARANGEGIVRASQSPNYAPGGVLWQSYQWSNDSRYIVYLATFNSGYEELFAASADGVQQFNLSGPIAPGGHVESFEVQ